MSLSADGPNLSRHEAVASLEDCGISSAPCWPVAMPLRPFLCTDVSTRLRLVHKRASSVQLGRRTNTDLPHPVCIKQICSGERGASSCAKACAGCSYGTRPLQLVIRCVCCLLESWIGCYCANMSTATTPGVGDMCESKPAYTVAVLIPAMNASATQVPSKCSFAELSARSARDPVYFIPSCSSRLHHHCRALEVEHWRDNNTSCASRNIAQGRQGPHSGRRRHRVDSRFSRRRDGGLVPPRQR
jgi:hypothetical protein